MDLGQLLQEFFNDKSLQILLLIIVLDFAFGVLSALKKGDFRASYVSDFMRNDVLFKVLPWFILYSANKVATSADILIPGLALDALVWGAYGLIVTALVGSLINSLNELRLTAPDQPPQTLENALAGPENAGPPK